MAFCAPYSASFKPSAITRCTRNNLGGRNPNTPRVSLGHAAIGSDPLSSSTKLLNDEMSLDARRVKKVEEVRRILPRINDPLESMMMIDSLQCLSIDYHFQEEIQEMLHRQYNNLGRSAYKNLYDVALSFRLLRQHGNYVSPDIFADFRDDKGFKPELSKDTRGMLGLYEASSLAVVGEDVLDEARNFTRKHLQASMTSSVDLRLVGLISQTLEHPFHLSLPRFNTKAHLKNQQGAHVHTQLLRELAILDFHEVQSLHRRELREVSKWWRELGLAQELKFSRDQLRKWYMWPLAILSNPQFSKQRIELTKPISFIYIIDDIFDVQGTLDELILFTEAVKRWEVSAIHQLPRYMQICFMALYNVTNEISYIVFKEHGWNPLQSFRKAKVFVYGESSAISCVTLLLFSLSLSSIRRLPSTDIETFMNFMKNLDRSRDLNITRQRVWKTGLTTILVKPVSPEHSRDEMKRIQNARELEFPEIHIENFTKWADLCDAFLVEAKWFASGERPKAENYLKNGIISSGVNVLLVHAFFLLGHGITRESVESVDSIPGLVFSPATILRLWDDLGSAKDESQDGKDGSYAEYYMKENGIISPSVARDHVMQRISKEWKELNKECLHSNLFSPSFKEACLNTARMVQIMYSYDQNQRLPALEGSINSLLKENVLS